MLRLTLCLVLIPLSTAGAWGDRPDEKPAAAAGGAEKAFRAYLDAGVARDEKALARLLAEDFTLTRSDGKVLSRAETMGLYLSPDIRQEKTDVSEVKTRLYGDVAVLTVRSVEKGTKNGQRFRHTLQTTATLVVKDGAWLIVAEHVSSAR